MTPMGRRSLIFLFLLAASAFQPLRAAVAIPDGGGTPLKDPRFWIVLPAADAAARSRIADAGVSIESIERDRVGGVANLGSIRRLQEFGIPILEQTPLEAFRAKRPSGGIKRFPPDDQAYRDYAQLQQELASIASESNGAATLFSIGTSVEGRDITGIRFTLARARRGLRHRPKPAALFLGTHHAREHLSTEVPLLLARWLSDNRDRPEVRRLLRTREIYIIPLVNPDGAEYDHATGAYAWQRKNMRQNEDGSLGVDLNRNYGYHWGEGGASTDPGSDIYRGPAPFSEPETRAVRDFINSHPNLKVLVSYHTFSELILYPWGYTSEPIEDSKALLAYKAMAQKMAEWTGYTPMQSSDLYVASGDTCDWAWGEKGIFSFTFELTPRSLWDGGFYPGAGVIEPTFQKNLLAALYLIELADDPLRAAESFLPPFSHPIRGPY